MPTPDAPIKITELDELINVGSDDLFVVVDMSGVEPVTKQAKRSNTSPSNPVTNNTKYPYTDAGNSGSSITITADKNKVVKYSANSATLAITIDYSSLSATDVVDLSIEFANTSGGNIAVTWTNAPVGNWVDGIVLAGILTGKTHHVGMSIGSSGVRIAKSIKAGA